MMQYILGKWISMPISLVARLGITDLLASGSHGIEKLAEATDTHAQSLYRIMRALAAIGIFHEDKAKHFSLTPLGECLKSDDLRYQAILFHSEWHDRAWSELEHAVKTGEAAFDNAFGKPVFKWLVENPIDAMIHSMAMASNLGPRTQAIIQSFDFGPYSLIVDVGAGNATLLASIATNNPEARCVAADLPHAAIEAEKTFNANGLSDRCLAESCDFMERVPADGDLYILSNVLHDWDDDSCQIILSNCRKAMQKDSKILIVEFMVPPANVFSPAKLLDIEMMVMSGGGRERTKDEFCDLLAAAGLNIEKITPLVTGEALLDAVIIR
jgi:hypothetical protein